jgi:hypothetical protein
VAALGIFETLGQDAKAGVLRGRLAELAVPSASEG